MSKYFWTKDGRIIKIDKQTDISYDIGTFEVNNKAGIVASYDPIEVLKQADTIEELSDAFVYNDKAFKNVIYENISNVKTLCSLRKEWIVYAAIWTDFGLKYVAKMNDKGDWKLI